MNAAPMPGGTLGEAAAGKDRAASEAAIVQWIREALAEMLDRPLDEIDPALSFAQLGVDSGAATNLILALEDWLGIETDPQRAMAQPTMSDMAAYARALLGDRRG